MNPFEARVAVVTGGASGIGRALVEELSRRGATVVVADRNGAGAREAAAALQAGGGKADALELDVADGDAVERAVGSVWDRHGGIDFFFNNAGVGGPAAEVHEITLEEWRHVLQVNLHGVIHGVAAVYPRMVRRGSGHIVNTASLAGLIPNPILGPYTTAKHGVVGLSKALRAEAHAYGVRVSVVCPGHIDTPIFTTSTRIKRFSWEQIRALVPPPLSAAGCARVILRGVARNRPFIVVTGWAKAAWWLWRISPRLTQRLAALSMRSIRGLYDRA